MGLMQSVVVLVSLLFIRVRAQQCGEGTYPTYYQNGTFISCQNCVSPCSNCQNQVNGECTSCQSTYYSFQYTYNTVNKKYCLRISCPVGKYYDGTQCHSCNQACENCFGGTSTQCLSCKIGYYQSSQSTCSKCFGNCLSCITNSTNCLSCLDTYFRSVGADNGGTCSVCPSDTCIECSNGGTHICRTCKTKYFNDQIDANTHTGTCKECVQPCSTCLGSESSCSSCVDNYYLDINNNPGGTGVCNDCQWPCVKCVGSGNDVCVTCVETKYLKTISTTADVGSCESCPDVCQTCGNGGFDICLTCKKNMPKEYFFKMTNAKTGTGICIECPQQCDTCIDGGTDVCEQCGFKYGYRVFLSMTSPSSKTGICIWCPDKNCSTCSDSDDQNVCSSCDHNNDYYLGTTSVAKGTGICHYCPEANCKDCKDGTPNVCMSCHIEQEQYLAITDRNTNTGICQGCPSQCNSSCIDSGPNICTNCSERYFLHLTNDTDLTGYCISCYSSCQTCVAAQDTKCLTCITDYFHKVLNITNNTGTCSICPQECDDCDHGGSDICLDCHHKYFFTKTNGHTGICNACHYTCSQCSGLSANSCKVCDENSHRFMNQSNYCICGPFYMDDKQNNQMCIDLECDYGSGQSENSTGYCDVVCGDGLVGNGEQCDDFNLNYDDGCSDKCKIQDGFKCQFGSKISQSECMYTKFINVSVSSIDKDPYKNTIYITLTLSMTIEIMQRWDFLSVFSLGFSVEHSSFNYSNGVVIFTLDYSQNINLTGKFLQLKVDLARATKVKTEIQPYNVTYYFDSSNNLAINTYPKQVYNQVESIFTFSRVVVFAGLGVFLLGLVRGKVIGLQLSHILQIAYFGLVIIKQADPLFYSMKQLVYSNGYNLDLFNPKYSSLPMNYSYLNIQQQLTENMNIMFGMPFLVLCIALVLFIVSKVSKSAKRRSLTEYKNLILGEFTFVSMIFLSTPVSFYLGVMVRYFVNAGAITYASFVLAGLYFIGLVGILVPYKLKNYIYFGEFKTFFKEMSYFQFYYIFAVTQRVVIGAVLGAAGASYITGAVVIGIFLVHCILIGVYQPYSLKQQNVRSMLIMLAGISVFAIYLSVAIMGPSYIGGGFTVYSPYAVLGILSLAIILSLVFVILQLKKFIEIHLQQYFIKQQDVQPPPQFEDFERQLQRRAEQGQDNHLVRALVRMGRPKKKKRPTELTFEMIDGIDIPGNELLERIVNFERYEEEWLKREISRESRLCAVEQENETGETSEKKQQNVEKQDIKDAI